MLHFLASEAFSFFYQLILLAKGKLAIKLGKASGLCGCCAHANFFDRSCSCARDKNYRMLFLVLFQRSFCMNNIFEPLVDALAAFGVLQQVNGSFVSSVWLALHVDR